MLFHFLLIIGATEITSSSIKINDKIEIDDKKIYKYTTSATAKNDAELINKKELNNSVFNEDIVKCDTKSFSNNTNLSFSFLNADLDNYYLYGFIKDKNFPIDKLSIYASESTTPANTDIKVDNSTGSAVTLEVYKVKKTLKNSNLFFILDHIAIFKTWKDTDGKRQITVYI